MSYGFIKEFDYLKSFISKQQIIEVFKGVATKVYWHILILQCLRKTSLRSWSWSCRAGIGGNGLVIHFAA